MPLAQNEPGPPTNQAFQLVFPGVVPVVGLEVATVEVDYTGARTPSILKVTFTTAPPAIVGQQSYTFQGLTAYPALNGVTLAPASVAGDTVTFVYSSGQPAYGPTADTGETIVGPQAMVQGPGLTVPPGCSVTIEPVNGAGLNTETCYIAQYAEALGTPLARPLVKGTGDVVLPWPVSNLCEIYASGTPGDGILIKVQGGGIQ